MTFSHFSLRRTRTMATLSRSLFLLRSFGYEQSDPAYFYGNLAEDTAQFIASLYSDRVVGGAPAAAQRSDSRRWRRPRLFLRSIHRAR